MDKTKKSITAEELADKIKTLKPGLTTKQMMAELRKQYTFSKDKWAQARQILSKGEIQKKDSIKPCNKHCCKWEPSDETMNEFYDALDIIDDRADDIALNILEFCKRHPENGIAHVNICHAAHPSLFKLLDSAVEAGLLREVHGYVLGDAYSLQCAKKDTKKTTKK